MGVLGRVRIGVSVPIGVGVSVLVRVSVFARHLVGRVAAVLLGRGHATSRQRGQHGREQHEHGDDRREDPLHTISDPGRRGR